MPSQNHTATRNLALTIMCPDCHAAPGDECFRRSPSGKRVPLFGPAAHARRIAATENAGQLPFDERSHR